eukprot:5559459-Amphidinium_carterae.1
MYRLLGLLCLALIAPLNAQGQATEYPSLKFRIGWRRCGCSCLTSGTTTTVAVPTHKPQRLYRLRQQPDVSAA